MTKLALSRFLAVTLILTGASATAQKVKYKDIFGLLNTKQYESAEPFLKKYLRENDDNPNAFLFMGIIFHEKSGKMDILKQTPLVISIIDSAIMFYDKANKTIDEREVRKNKDYYQSYSRRDLRTGEFGINASDIHFDLEKKIQTLKERIDGIKLVKHYFALADTSYKKANANYVKLQKVFDTERQLYLRSDEATVASLKHIVSQYDSCIKAFDHYKTSSSALGRTGYNQVITPQEIGDFKKDGSSLESFYKDDIKIWDYKKFGDRTTQIIEQDVMPMRNHLVKYDVEINKLREKLNTDSVSVKNDLTKLIDVLLYEQLKKYDSVPLPMQVFYMKTADLEYRSTLIEHKNLKDSADLNFRVALLKDEMRALGKLDSISTMLANSDIDQRAIDYAYFITNTFSNTIVLHSYVKALNEFAQREKVKKQGELDAALSALNWIVDGTDQVPLLKENASEKFQPLATEPEKYTAGLTYKDSVNADGYFYLINPARLAKVKVSFPVDKPAFKSARINNTRALVFADAQGHFYYVLFYSDKLAKDKYPATLAKIYASDGLAWSNNLQLGFVPTEIQFKPETSELTIKDDTAQIGVDKNGKVVR